MSNAAVVNSKLLNFGVEIVKAKASVENVTKCYINNLHFRITSQANLSHPK
jgi:hypothetical protein